MVEVLHTIHKNSGGRKTLHYKTHWAATFLIAVLAAAAVGGGGRWPGGSGRGGTGGGPGAGWPGPAGGRPPRRGAGGRERAVLGRCLRDCWGEEEEEEEVGGPRWPWRLADLHVAQQHNTMHHDTTTQHPALHTPQPAVSPLPSPAHKLID